MVSEPKVRIESLFCRKDLSVKIKSFRAKVRILRVEGLICFHRKPKDLSTEAEESRDQSANTALWSSSTSGNPSRLGFNRRLE